MDNKTRLVVGIIGAIAIVIAAIIGYQAAIKPVEKQIEATQTAEAQLPTSTTIPTQTQVPTATQTLIPTETMTPTITLALTPTPIFVVDTSNRVGWVPYFENSKGDNTINEVSSDENAIKLTYDVGNGGYVGITKKINPGVLKDTVGISFLYKGRGAPNAIEFKLLLKYPGDSDDTTYGITIPMATDTGNKWMEMKVLYHYMECWWPDENCDKYGELLDVTMVHSLDFVVTPKYEGVPGSGWVIFRDVFGILP